jgi:decaprenylphospho-beta-D-erythro-pentofuranosid-2-ulose 2-reductase
MHDAFGKARSIAILGGRSDIGRAITARLVAELPHATIASCVRGASDTEIEFDGTDPDSMRSALEAARNSMGDIDCVIVAFGDLASESEMLDDEVLAWESVVVNHAGAVAAGIAAADVLGARGGGSIVYLSSVAGVRVRSAMSVYGSAKRGADAFYRAAGERWAGRNIATYVVRPGYVHSKMTKDVAPTIGATGPGEVAAAVVAAMRGGGTGVHIVYSSSLLRIIAAVMRIVPAALWRRISR